MHHLPAYPMYYPSPEQLKSAVTNAGGLAGFHAQPSLFTIDSILAPRPYLPGGLPIQRPPAYGHFPYPGLPPAPQDFLGKASCQ